MYPVLLSALFVAITNAQLYTIELDIRKREPISPSSTLLGKLTIHLSPELNNVDADIDPYLDDLISPSDFTPPQPLVLEFVVTNTNHPAYANHVFMTAVDEIITQPHGQKISIVMGSDREKPSINSISYVQTRDRVGEIYTEVVRTVEKVEEVFRYAHIPKKSQAEDESFFTRYKWPLIIGGVIIYTMLTVDPQQGQQGAAAAGGQGRSA